MEQPRPDKAGLPKTVDRTNGYFSLTPTDAPSRNLVTGNVVTYSPLVTFNRWPRATAAHEQTHFRLVNSTPFGLFYRVVSKRNNGHAADLDRLILDAQWLPQEAASTYIGLATLATSHELDSAVEQLPSEILRQPPYREAYDLLDAVLPLAEAIDTHDEDTCAFMAEAVATWALSGDVLLRFRTPADCTEAALKQYLDAHAPSRRFLAMLEAMRSSPQMPALRRNLRAKIEELQDSVGGLPDDVFWALVDQLQGLLPLESNWDVRSRGITMGQFARAWRADSEQQALAEWQDETPIPSGAFNTQPEIIVGGTRLTPFTPAFVDLRKGESIDLGPAAGFALRANPKQYAVFLAVVIRHRDQLVSFRPTVYRVDGDGVNPAVPAEALMFVTQYSGPIHTCTTAQFAATLSAMPLPIGAVSFLGHSWTHWQVRHAEVGVPILTSTLSRDRGTELGDAVRICVEADLSGPHLAMLLAGAGLSEGTDAFLFEFSDDQWVACILPREPGGVYLLQLVSGSMAFEVFDHFAKNNRIRLVPPHASIAQPHLPLLAFVGELLLFEAIASSSQAD